MTNRNPIKYRRGQRGQVLMLAVLAIIILVTAIMILFDVQRIIRGKIHVMSGIDAAALTGAEWQKHTLNLIGELNLIKACHVLISDSIYGIGGSPDDFMKVNISENASEAEISAAIEKGFQGGGDKLRERGYDVFSLAIVDNMENGKITFRK